MSADRHTQTPPLAPICPRALTGCTARVAQVWCSSLVDAAGYVDAPTSSLWACGRGLLRVPESSVFVHRVVRPRSGTKYYRLVMGVCVRVRVARVPSESALITLVNTLRVAQRSRRVR